MIVVERRHASRPFLQGRCVREERGAERFRLFEAEGGQLGSGGARLGTAGSDLTAPWGVGPTSEPTACDPEVQRAGQEGGGPETNPSDEPKARRPSAPAIAAESVLQP